MSEKLSLGSWLVYDLFSGLTLLASISKRSISLGTPPALRTKRLAFRNLAKFAMVSQHNSWRVKFVSDKTLIVSSIPPCKEKFF